MDHLLKTFADKDADLTPDEIYDLGIALRNIGTNYNSVSLLKVSIDYVNAHPGVMSH